jgi:8-oxo-dGTP pyrophosphatase MutT (NUDIX family)
MPHLHEIEQSLARYRPRLIERPVAGRAAVAMVLRDGAGGTPEVLLIERAHRPGDPWSGHMAFPGGRVSRDDPSPQAAAERETLEEVGLHLGPARQLGRLDDLEGRHAGRPVGLVISGFVYHHEAPGRLRANHEVEEILWVPVRELAAAERRVAHAYPAAGELTYPGILVGRPDRHVVWGLTYRFLEIFFEIVGRPLPSRWGIEHGAR